MKNLNAVVLFAGLLIFGSLLIYSIASNNSLLDMGKPSPAGTDLTVERVVLGVLLLASIGLAYLLGNRKK